MSKLLQTLSEEECKKLLDTLAAPEHYVSSSPATVRNFTMALIMLDTGLRVSELVNLQIADLWFHDAPVHQLLVRHEIAKRHKSREIPLTERLSNAIFEMSREAWLGYLDRPHYPAFSSRWADKRLSTRQVQRIICRAATAALGRCVHPHVLRHTFATRLMRKTNIRIVQELLGHSWLSTTQIYTHPNNQDLKKAIEGLE